ncbi:hypothetical protein BFR91_03425 [Acinetobacter pittii]|jgi:hypothetical protein|nr:hypothetical protein BFR91_03425 [Acinetobacter pittii]
MTAYNDFSVDYFSDTRYEKITIEISYKNQILCQLNKDKGNDNIEIQFFHEWRILPDQVIFKFPLEEFISLLNELKQDLISA